MVGKPIRTDQGAYYDVVQEGTDGWLLMESLGHRVRAYARVTGRTVQRLPGGGYGRRVALHRAEDIGLVKFAELTETLRPGERIGGGWTCGW